MGRPGRSGSGFINRLSVSVFRAAKLADDWSGRVGSVYRTPLPVYPNPDDVTDLALLKAACQAKKLHL